MFIVVSGRPERMHEIPAYLYAGQTVVSGPDETFTGACAVVDTGSGDRYRAEYVAARLNSGLFGTALFDTLDEAEAYVRGQRMIGGGPLFFG